MLFCDPPVVFLIFFWFCFFFSLSVRSFLLFFPWLLSPCDEELKTVLVSSSRFRFLCMPSVVPFCLLLWFSVRALRSGFFLLWFSRPKIPCLRLCPGFLPSSVPKILLCSGSFFFCQLPRCVPVSSVLSPAFLVFLCYLPSPSFGLFGAPLFWVYFSV